MIAIPGVSGRRVGVLGLARAGKAVARALLASGATPVLHDDAPGAAERFGLDGAEPADLVNGPWPGLDLLVTSPGVPHLYPRVHPAIARAFENGVPLDDDIGLFLDALRGSGVATIAVTGTNGKSTTTALLRHLAEAAGRRAEMAGNIGRAVFDLEMPAPGDVVVVELSSFQLDTARCLATEVAIFLNLTPDHHDRHGGHGGYFGAKRRLFDLGRPRVAVIGVDEDEGRFLAATRDPAATVRISVETRPAGPGRTLFRDGGDVVEAEDGREIARYPLAGIDTLRGTHNAQNAAAAIAALRALDIAPAAIAAGLATYPGLAHRMEIVGRRGRVTFVNDSKATNAESTAKALAAYPNAHWIAGGKPKEGGIASLAGFFPALAGAYLIGAAAAEFADTIGGATPVTRCGDLATAVARAAADAAADPGEAVVLLSPACASYDQFTDFEARGDAFRCLVAELPAPVAEGERRW